VHCSGDDYIWWFLLSMWCYLLSGSSRLFLDWLGLLAGMLLLKQKREYYEDRLGKLV
jgi:hypothetical protein